MQRSASDVEITSETLISIKQESSRWGLGHTSLVFCGLGILILACVLAGAHSEIVTVGWIGLLALSVTFSVGGLMGAISAFGDRKTDKVRTAFATELDKLETFANDLETRTRESSDETRLQLTTLMGAVRLMSKRLDEVTALLAQVSMEVPAAVGQTHPAPRQRRRRSRRETGDQAGATSNVVNMPTAKVYQLGIAEGLRRRKSDDKDKNTDK